MQCTFELVLHFSEFVLLSSSICSCGNSTSSLVLISFRQRGQRAISYPQTHTQGAQGKDGSINDWQLNYWLHTNETSPFKFNCQMKMKLQTPAACWGQHTYLLSADNLGDAGPAVNVGAVCNNRKPERVQAHRALLIRAAGQHQPQLLYQMLPQLRRCRCSTYRQNIW